MWRDVESVISREQEVFPDGVKANSRFAYWAWKCGKWKMADEQFKRLGDKVSVAIFDNNPAELEKARSESAAKASGLVP